MKAKQNRLKDIKALRRKGLTYKAIANLYGVTPQRIHAMLHRQYNYGANPNKPHGYERVKKKTPQQ